MEIFFLGGLMLIMVLIAILTAVNLPDKFVKTSKNSSDVVLDIVTLFNLSKCLKSLKPAT